MNSSKQTKEDLGKVSQASGLPIVQKRSYQASYGQIRYLMKRLATALDKRLREGRPSKYCRLCKAEIQSFLHEEKEKQHRRKLKERKEGRAVRRSSRNLTEARTRKVLADNNSRECKDYLKQAGCKREK